MPSPNFVLLYVDSPLASAELYTQLLETAPVESLSTFGGAVPAPTYQYVVRSTVLIVEPVHT
jgi:hypothetical protein